MPSITASVLIESRLLVQAVAAWLTGPDQADQEPTNGLTTG